MTLTRRVATPVGLFSWALLVRALPWPTVLAGRRLFLPETDAYYHLRRVGYSLKNFPDVLEYDRYINFPRGGKPIWPPYFDSLMAWICRPFYGLTPGDGVEQLLIWMPPVLGAVTVVTLYFLAKRYFGFWVAFFSGLVLSVQAGHFQYSQLGFIDHHVAVALVSLLLLSIGMDFLAGCRSRWLVVVAGSLLAAILLLWPGTLLHVTIVEIAFLAYLLTRSTQQQALAVAGRLTVAHALAFLLVLGPSLQSAWPQWGEFSPVVLSRFQPWFFGVLTAYFALCTVGWRSAAGGTLCRRVAFGCFLGVSLLGGSMMVLPGLKMGLVDAWQWFAKRESFQAHVVESASILVMPGGLKYVEMCLSRFIYFLPLILIALVDHAKERHDRASLLLLVGWSSVLTIATVIQQRFYNSLSVVLALLAGWSCVRLYKLLPVSWRELPWRRVMMKIAIGGLMVYLLAPMVEQYDLHLANQGRVLLGEQVLINVSTMHHRNMVSVAEWLQENTPTTRGLWDATVVPEYGVLGTWEVGHTIKSVGERPTVVDNFGDDVGSEGFDAAASYFESPTEQVGARILEDLGVRYVVVQRLPQVARQMPSSDPPTLLHRLYWDHGSQLGHHRLVFESPTVLGNRPDTDHQADFKVFQYVAGARLSGDASPGATIIAQLDYITNQGRMGTFQTEAVANEEGRYSLRLPYANGDAPPGIRSRQAYRVASGGREVDVVITEDQVQQGAEVAGPDFRTARRPLNGDRLLVFAWDQSVRRVRGQDKIFAADPLCRWARSQGNEWSTFTGPICGNKNCWN